jgi:RimJ/RimL family protein N-acetyltransferase
MIYGKRIRLRADERADLPLFVEWLNDPEVRQGISYTLPLSQAVEEQWFENMLKMPREEQPLGIEIRTEDGGWRLIGNCSYMDLNWRSRSAEVGIFIGDKTCWDKGYGTEVMRLLLQHGFETKNLNRIFLHVFATNLRAIRCYEKAGFVPEGRLRQAEFKDGGYVDFIVMSVLRSEYTRDEPVR